MFYSYEELRDGLIQRFGVPDLMVPSRDYFEATPDEREIDDDPIYRTVAFWSQFRVEGELAGARANGLAIPS
jgi:hypothetical protein